MSFHFFPSLPLALSPFACVHFFLCVFCDCDWFDLWSVMGWQSFFPGASIISGGWYSFGDLEESSVTLVVIVRHCLDEMVYDNSKVETKLRVDVGTGLTASELFLSYAVAKSKWSDLTWSYRCSSIYKLYSLLRSELSNCYLNTQNLILLIEIPETPCLIKLVVSTSLFILPPQLPAT